MRRVLVLIVAAAAMATGGASKPTTATAPYAWPAVTYKAKPRDAKWLEATYAYFRTRIAVLEGQAVDTARVYETAHGLAIGRCATANLRIAQVIDDDEMLLSYEGMTYDVASGASSASGEVRFIHVKGIATAGLVDGGLCKDAIAAIGTYRYVTVTGAAKTIVSCIPLPTARPPLSRPQFVDAIKSGFELARWRRAPNPDAKRFPGFARYIYRRYPVE